MKAPHPEREAERLAALHNYQILDTAPEQLFDDITILAAQICATPIALISLVDADRQWFKAKVGLAAAETPREVAFCAHGICGTDLFVVEDASLDSRFSSHPMVTAEPGVRFYAGAPLIIPGGQAVGMLCVNDYKPRQLSAQQSAALLALGRQTVALFELRHHVVELSKTLASRQDTEGALRQAEEKLRHIFEKSAEGIFQTTPDGRLITANPAFARMLGYATPAEAIARTTDVARQVYRNPEIRDEFQKLLLQHGSVTAFEAEWVRCDGRHICASMAAHVVRDPKGEVLFYEGTARDITALKEADEALRQSHDQLELRVEERTKELQHLNNELLAEIQFREHAQEDLQATQQQLLDASREAGKADFATGILHNIGNVISSINVSTTLVSDKVRNSNIVNLAKAVALLEVHREDLPGFFANHPKGKLLLPFLSDLAAHLGQEQKALIAELATLRASVEHIKEIVTLQQGYAKVSGQRELLTIANLVDDALRLSAGTILARHIRVHREYSSLAPTEVDKHKVLQILVNLIRNAQQALKQNADDDREITVAIEPGQDARGETVRISVIDNGVGISPENLGRIFSRGFTTRASGHGFGLHSARLVAEEMKGTLIAQSAGQGKGATFTLEIPFSPVLKERLPSLEEPASLSVGA